MKKLGGVIAGLLLVLGISIFTPVISQAEENSTYTYYVDDGEAIITGLTYEVGNNLDKLVLPDTLDGFPVTTINNFALSGRGIREIVIPDSVVYIGYGAFSGNADLRSVELPANLKAIEGNVFSSCTNLTTVKMGNKIESIGNGAFEGCYSLKKIAIPDSVTQIASYAFANCYKLAQVSLGNKVREIGRRCFYRNQSLKSIVFPKSVKTIDDSAFSKCKSLTGISFKNSKVKMGKYVFRGCKSLVTASLPSKSKMVPEGMFAECEKLRSVKLPDTVSIIKKNTFRKCYDLKKFKLNKAVYAIGDNAFAESGLEKITLNKKLQFIGNGTFFATNLKSIKLHDKVTYIGNRLFADCNKLKTIYVPSSVKGINPGAFNNCVSLRSIRVAEGNKYYSSRDGVLYNKKMSRLIQYPSHKTNAVFTTTSSLRDVRSHAFEGNRYLKRVVIKAKRIGHSAFQDMKNLQSVTLLDGTQKIAANAFSGDGKLKNITLPDSVKKIGMEAFAGAAVKTFHLPSSLETLESDVFFNCSKLVEFEGDRSEKYSVRDGVLYNRKGTKLIKYPARKADKKFVVPVRVKSVGVEAFSDVKNLKQLEFGRNVRRLAYHAIIKCPNLKSIAFKVKKNYLRSYYSSIDDCEKLAVIVGPNDYVMSYLASQANATLITL